MTAAVANRLADVESPKVLPAIRTGKAKATGVSALLVAPLVIFITLVFILPLGSILFYAVNNPELRLALPGTVVALEHWEGHGLPAEPAFAALAMDLRKGSGGSQISEAGRRLNYEIAGFRSLFLKTARVLGSGSEPAGNWKDELIRIDSRWADPSYWAALQRASPSITPYYLLAALDLRINDHGSIVPAPVDERLFLETLGRTLWIGCAVTVLCLLIGYPLAHALVSLPKRFASALLLCVLLPFWTSLLVRTSAWIVVLQKEGIVNSALLGVGIIDEPLQLVFNRTGLYIAMTHILLPFMVLPILSSMKGISPVYMRASSSLGAHPVIGFFKVYLPLTMPGVGAGCLLTFIIAAGYYITPTLVGGAKDQMLSYFVAFYANTTINWGMSSALGAVLLVTVIFLYATVGRLIGVGRIAGID